MELTREQALELLKEYNKEPFHLRHALTVEAVMRWVAQEPGYGGEAGFRAAPGPPPGRAPRRNSPPGPPGGRRPGPR